MAFSYINFLFPKFADNATNWGGGSVAPYTEGSINQGLSRQDQLNTELKTYKAEVDGSNVTDFVPTKVRVGGGIDTGEKLQVAGKTKVQVSDNSAFAVQNGTGSDVLSVDTINNIVTMAGLKKYRIFFGSLTATPVSTGISINAFGGGKTITLSYSTNSGAGNSTNSTITMVRCGYDGNNFEAVDIATLGSASIKPIYTQVGGILYVAVTTNTGNSYIAVEMNK